MIFTIHANVYVFQTYTRIKVRDFFRFLFFFLRYITILKISHITMRIGTKVQRAYFADETNVQDY